MPEQRLLTVLTSMRDERPTTNPYVIELNRRLATRVNLRRFSWRELLVGHWDVFHVHWPDALVQRSTRVRTIVAAALLTAGMLRTRLSGRRVVRTLHNVAPHEVQSPQVRAAMRVVDRTTSGWIRLNDHTPVPGPGVVVTIPHGTYSEWFAAMPHREPVPGRLLCPGLARPYKGIETLLAAFAEVPGDGLTLHVSGRASDPDYAKALAARASADSRVRLDLRHLSDDEMATEIGEAALVVLPYREFHNSGVALLALSLGRPILVPDNEVTRDLAAEVGADWVRFFDGVLDAAALWDGVSSVGSLAGEPDLSRRAWEQIADEHSQFFQRVASAPRRRVPR